MRRLGLDEHLTGIERHPRLHPSHTVLFGMEGGYVKESLDVEGGINAEVDCVKGFIVSVRNVLVECTVLILRHRLWFLQPNGINGIHQLPIEINRKPYKVGILFENGFNGRIVGILIQFGFQVEHHGRSTILPNVRGESRDAVLPRALRFPNDGIIIRRLDVISISRNLSCRFGTHVDLVGDHESGVKSHAEFADDALTEGIDVVGRFRLLLALHCFHEGFGTTARDGSQIGYHFILGHSDTRVGNGQCIRRLVCSNANFQRNIIRRGARQGAGGLDVSEFFECVTGVGH
mmetsp:Transcript_37858/g.81728  ORF Transcript_37858/g.81728 Transcript_37858/m.81728 type:complete len:290 (-) Transcript_37858:479-1348(-)